MSTSWKAGSTRAWRRTRAAVLQRDGWECQLRIPGVCTLIARCVHHTQGKGMGDDMHLLVASCTECNARVGDPTRHADPRPRGRTRW